MLRPVWMIHLCILIGCVITAGCSRDKSVLDGVYTAVQAARGATVYNSYCTDCHTVGSVNLNRPLRGRGFIDNWREDSLKPLFDKIKTTMPSGAPSTLSDRQYVDVLAFILEKNGFPEGRKELNKDILPDVLLTGRDGPKPLPSGTVVQTVGCLTRVSEDSWQLTGSSGFVRTRVRRDFTSDELKTMGQQRPGRDRVVLHIGLLRLFSGNFDLLPLMNRRVVVAGKLVREGSDVYIELVRARGIGDTCER